MLWLVVLKLVSLKQYLDQDKDCNHQCNGVGRNYETNAANFYWYQESYKSDSSWEGENSKQFAITNGAIFFILTISHASWHSRSYFNFTTNTPSSRAYALCLWPLRLHQKWSDYGKGRTLSVLGGTKKGISFDEVHTISDLHLILFLLDWPTLLQSPLTTKWITTSKNEVSSVKRSQKRKKSLHWGDYNYPMQLMYVLLPLLLHSKWISCLCCDLKCNSCLYSLNFYTYSRNSNHLFWYIKRISNPKMFKLKIFYFEL